MSDTENLTNEELEVLEQMSEDIAQYQQQNEPPPPKPLTEEELAEKYPEGFDVAKDGSEEPVDFDVEKYLNENGLIEKWQSTGLLESVKTNSEKYLIASIMEAMIFKSFDMQVNEGKSEEEIVKFHDMYLQKMSELGIFNGNIFKEIFEQIMPS